MSTKDSISAKVIKDSISPDGVRLTTLHLHYPRAIHAEVMTHRVFSRNARSTRAVPTSKLIDEVKNNPYVPIKWGSNKPGMQAGADLSPDDAAICEHLWLEGAKNAADTAAQLFGMGLHKQWAGRGLEPYLYIDTLVTSTDWSNFFGLRIHSDAQPEFDCLADKVYQALDKSEPQEKAFGQWHLPYIEDADIDAVLEYTTVAGGGVGPLLIQNAMMNIRLLSAARCARISYAPFDGSASIEAELERAARLAGPPLHASPFEHQATPDRKVYGTMSDDTGDQEHVTWLNQKLHGNFYGWVQNRKLMTGENISQFLSLNEGSRI